MQRTFLILFVVVAGCLPGAATGTTSANLGNIASWAIQLQDADIDALANAPYDLVVIDYSYYGDAATEYTFDEIQSIRNSGKVVLAYFSCGEAEDYRFYWKSSWGAGERGIIGEENPDWEGNYTVKYWTNSWWTEALQPYLDRILDAGCDGVYLDRVDAYWDWYEAGVPLKQSADRMAQLVRKIAEYARARAGDGFMVCPQNGISILDDASSTWAANYLADIDAVGEEGLYYNLWSNEDQQHRLDLLSGAGKLVLNLEYMGPAWYEDYIDILAASSLDIVGYAADPDEQLDELILYE
jgi:cysteinyl-tRNA synthetase